MSKIKAQKVEIYENGSPCKNIDCINPKRKHPCEYCGRTNARGNTKIQTRTGPVHYERLWKASVKEHNDLPIEEQGDHLLELYRAPKND